MKNLVLALSISLMGQFAAAQNLPEAIVNGSKALEVLVSAPKSVESAAMGIQSFAEAAGVTPQALKAMTATERSALVKKVAAKKGGMTDLANLTHYQSSVTNEVAAVKGAEGANSLVEKSLGAKSANGKAFDINKGFQVLDSGVSAELSTIKNAKEIANIPDAAVRGHKVVEAEAQFKIAKMMKERNGVQPYNESLEAQCNVGTTVETASKKAEVALNLEKRIAADKSIDDVREVTAAYMKSHEEVVGVDAATAKESTIQLAEKCDVLKPVIGTTARLL